MKIAMFYAHWKEFSEPWSTPMSFQTELESRGHEIIVYNLYHANGALMPRKNIRTYSSECWNLFHADFVNGYKPDVVLVMDYGVYDSYSMDKKFYPGVKFILEAGDTPQSFMMHSQKASKFHGLLTPDAPSAVAFNKLGINTMWSTHFADHRIFYPRDIKPRWDCVTTCGGRRVTAAIQTLLGDSFNNERYFFGNEHAERLCMGKMAFQCSQYGEITRRVFEGMACGRMMITDRLSPLTHMPELFIDGEDIVYYDEASDAIDKIRYYAEHDAEREQIASNGHKKVMQNHTVVNRVNDFEQLVQEVIYAQ